MLWLLMTPVEITQPVPYGIPHVPCSFSCTDQSLFPHVCLFGFFPSRRFVHFTAKSFCHISLCFFTPHFNQNLGFCNTPCVSTSTSHRTFPFLPLITKLSVGVALRPRLTTFPFSISLHLLHYNIYIPTTTLAELSRWAQPAPVLALPSYNEHISSSLAYLAPYPRERASRLLLSGTPGRTHLLCCQQILPAQGG